MSGALYESAAAPSLADRLTQARMALRERLNEWFPDRQLLIRGPGNVTSLTLTQRQQLTGAGVAAGIVLWAAAASVGMVAAIGGDAATALAKRQLAAALAQSQATVEAMQTQNAQLVALRAEDVARADAARDAAIAHANAVVAAYNLKLSQLTEKTQGTIGQVETIIKSTGLNPQTMAPRPPPPEKAAPDSSPQAMKLLQDLAHLKSLASLLTQVPLAAPLAYISVSSPYGFRPDPWTGAREFHVGVDLRGPIGTPVYATAPGVVSFAGVQTGYGNIVIIDHGFGLSTRYSHLSKILVRVGADVDLHQVIGLLGSTGWSTGPHLLYETRVDGQPHDPLNFIKVNCHGVQN